MMHFKCCSSHLKNAFSNSTNHLLIYATKWTTRFVATSASTGVMPLPENAVRYGEFFSYLKHAQQRLSCNSGEGRWPPSLLEFLGNNKELAKTNLCNIVESIGKFDSLFQNFEEVESLLADSATELNLNDREDLISIAEDEKSGLVEEIHGCSDGIVSDLCHLLSLQDSSDVTEVVLEVSAGVGGQEATLFTSELFHMYESFCVNFGQDFEILDLEKTDIGGYTKASASIFFNGEGMYDLLRQEGGTHRVQRVPLTENGGRVHTSTASVALLPSFDKQAEVLRENEIQITFVRKSNSPGGQHANKTESGVRIKHLPTGKIVQCNAAKSQDANKSTALQILSAKLLEERTGKQESDLARARHQQVKNRERSDKIRTYNYNRDRITDHRIGFSVHNIATFMRGDLTLLNLMKKLNEKQKFEDLDLTTKMLLEEGKQLLSFPRKS